VRILIASTPMTGHLNPLLTIGRLLIAEGHEVVGLTGSALRERIEGIGAQFQPLPAGADLDLRDILSVVPELKARWLVFLLYQKGSIEPMPALAVSRRRLNGQRVARAHRKASGHPAPSRVRISICETSSRWFTLSKRKGLPHLSGSRPRDRTISRLKGKKPRARSASIS
jgi:hypothetical protein